MVDVIADGLWLEDLAHVSEVEWSTRYDYTGPCGPYEASWRLGLRPRDTFSELGRGSLVTLLDGSDPRFVGISEEPTKGDDGWTFTARGLARVAEDYPALGAINPRTAVQNAIGLGWPVTLDASVPDLDVITGDTPASDLSVAAVLAAAAELTGLRWMVDVDRVVRFVADRTTLDYLIAPEVPLIGTADDEWRSRIELTYLNATLAGNPPDTVTGGADPAIEKRWGVRFARVDRTGLGPMTPTEAQALADKIAGQVAPRMGWATALTLSVLDVATPGDVPVGLGLIRAGELMQGTSGTDEQGRIVPTHGVRVIAGEVKYKDGEPTVSVAPIGLAPRGFDKALESVAAEARSTTRTTTSRGLVA